MVMYSIMIICMRYTVRSLRGITNSAENIFNSDIDFLWNVQYSKVVFTACMN